MECPWIKKDRDEWRVGELAFEPEQFKIFVRRFKDNCVFCLLPWCPFSSVCLAGCVISTASFVWF